MNRRSAATLGLGIVALGAVATAVWLGLPAAREEAYAGARSGELCTSCHEMPEHTARHAAAACTDCHGDSSEMAEQLTASWLLGTDAPEHGAVTAATCVTCHQPPSVPHGGHGGAQCATCHEGEHADDGPAPCARCHEQTERHGVTAETTCTTCHSFGGGSDEPNLASVTPPAAQTTMAQAAGLTRGLELDVVHGAMDCRRCHDPHREEQPLVECGRCHRGDFTTQLEIATSGHQDCGGCHEAHPDRAQPAVDCLQCHVLPVADQAWQTMPDGVPQLLREQAAQVTHDGQCGTCHTPHTWVATEQGCADCHDDHVSPVHEGCTSSCHQPHSPPPTGAVCRTCHEDVGHRGPLPREHADCLSCHDAHGARPDAAATCGSCHERAHGEGRRGPGRHRGCTTCHEAHGPPARGSVDACVGCHQTVATLLAPPGAALLAPPGAVVPSAHRCDSCHQAHLFAAGAPALSRCASCHASAVAEGASHRGSCEGCHQPHGAPGATSARCESCHAEVHPTARGHQRCDGCHTPHAPAHTATRTCDQCHSDVLARARLWPENGPHDGECAACHATHDERTTVACASCHLSESARRHTGGHATCVGCHTPHEQAPPASWWDRCAGCHAEAAAGAAASTGPTHSRCVACHETPGPPSPTCQSCHAEIPRRLSHRSHGETACTTCHASHGSSTIARDVCVGCHADRVAHFSDAPSCQSCHPFGT